MFSFTCLLEACNPSVFNRHLGADHTHLFSKKSLGWIYNTYSITPVAVWDFGCDILDLYRIVLHKLNIQAEADSNILDIAKEFFSISGDALQAVIDKCGFASETHVLAKIQRYKNNI